MTDDAELLRRYAEENSEEAFAEFVRRNLGLVYHAGLRQCGGDVHRAQDVAQTVFTDVARKAGRLARRPALAGWLHTSTRYAAAQAVRGEVRRQRREQEANAMNEILAKANGEDAAAAEWERMRPVIDEALHALPERDREAVLARFFEGRGFAEVGARLALSEDAARMRVERALEKLRVALVKRGITSTTAALGVALTSHAVAASAPADLAASVTAAALAGASSAAVVGGIFTFMSTTKITMGVVAAVALAAVGGAIYQAGGVRTSEARLVLAVRQQDELRAQLRTLEERAARATKRAEEAEADNAALLKATQSVLARAAAGRPATESGPLTYAAVGERNQRARELAKRGDAAEALKEFLWCFDDGMTRVATYRVYRREGLLDAMAKLGERLPEALAAMRARRDLAEKNLLENGWDMDSVADFVALNRALGDGARTLARFDQLPEGDPRRDAMGSLGFEQLMDAQRYAEAARARSYTQMEARFAAVTRERPDPAGTTTSEEARQTSREFAVKMAVNNIEVLAGAGEVARARTLAERLLAYDGSAETRTMLNARLARAGQPGLLAGATGGK